MGLTVGLLVLLAASTSVASVSVVGDGGVLADGGQIWALLAAGSSGWDNYRHQADVCHAYQVRERKKKHRSCEILNYLASLHIIFRVEKKKPLKLILQH